MAKQNYYEGIKHLVYLSTSGGATHCEVCSTQIDLDQIVGTINHYIEQHGYNLLHVGTETSRDLDGIPWLSTVAVLGK